MHLTGSSLDFLSSRFSNLLQLHDQEARNGSGRLAYRDRATINNLAKIVEDIGRTIEQAAVLGASSGADAAALVRMAIVNLGIDEDGDEPGHAALRAALAYLEDRPAESEFHKTKLSS